MATLDWFGCATFRLTIGELVVFLDAYLDRVPGAVGPGVVPEDIDRAHWIVIGHSHFDHLWGAERIARRTGASVIGSYETVRIMSAAGVPEDQLVPVSGGERVQLAPGVTVTAYPSLHSCVWTHRQMEQSDVVCLGDLGVTWQEQRRRLGELRAYFGDALGDAVREHLARASQGERGDGGALVYLFETADGSLLYQDTSGHWSGLLRNLRPDVAIIAAAGRGNVDGDPIQGSLAEFVARQAALVEAPTVILSHHDDWMPGFSIATDLAPIRAALAEHAPKSELVELPYVSGYPIPL